MPIAFEGSQLKLVIGLGQQFTNVHHSRKTPEVRNVSQKYRQDSGSAGIGDVFRSRSFQVSIELEDPEFAPLARSFTCFQESHTTLLAFLPPTKSTSELYFVLANHHTLKETE